MDTWLRLRFGPVKPIVPENLATVGQAQLVWIFLENDDAEQIGRLRASAIAQQWQHVCTVPQMIVEPGRPGSAIVFEKQSMTPLIDVSPVWSTLLTAAPCDYYRRLAEQFRMMNAAPVYLTPDQIDAMEAFRLLTATAHPDYEIIAAIELENPTQQAYTYLQQLRQKSAAVMVRFWSRTMVHKLAFEFEQEWVLPTGYDDADTVSPVHICVVERGGIDRAMRTWNAEAQNRGIVFLTVDGAGDALPSFFHATHHTVLLYQDLARFKALHATRPAQRAGGPPNDLPPISQLPVVHGMLRTVEPLHRLSVFFIGSVVLEVLGHTVGMDADMVAWNVAGHADIAALKETKLPDIDLALWDGRQYVGADQYVEKWYNHDWPALFGASNMEEAIYNPRYHLYWRRMKMMSLAGTVARLRVRARPAAMADLYSLKYKMGLPIDLPSCLPAQVIVGAETRDYTRPEVLDRTYKTTVRYLRDWQDMTVSLNDIQTAFPPCAAAAQGGKRISRKNKRRARRTIKVR